jgi:hypothetical protein
LNVARPLTITEIATVLRASRQAITAKTFRFGQGLEVLMGRAGQPKIVRMTYGIEGGSVSGAVSGSATPAETHWQDNIVSVIDYTGRPARRCDGSVEPGMLAIEYTFRGSTQAWTATTRSQDARQVGGPGITPVFEMLRGALPLASGERRRIGDRWARAFVSPWAPPADDFRARAPIITGDPMPNVKGEPTTPRDATESLWIDTKSLLPLRWEVSASGVLTRGFDFTYESIDLRRPPGIDAPKCIQ